MSTLRANTLKPITSGNSLVLQGDSGGSGVSGPSIDSNGDVDFSQNTNAKVKLPSGGGIYESDGSTEILTESSGSVTLKNTTLDSSISYQTGTQIGYNYHFKNTTQDIAISGTNTGQVITFDTNSSTQITANRNNSIFEITAHVSFGIQDGAFPAFFIGHSTDGSSFTDVLGPASGLRTRATFGGQYGEEANEDQRLFQSSMSVVVSPSLSAGSTFYYQLRGSNRCAGSSSINLRINQTNSNADGNRTTGVTFLKCVEISQ